MFSGLISKHDFPVYVLTRTLLVLLQLEVVQITMDTETVDYNGDGYSLSGLSPLYSSSMLFSARPGVSNPDQSLQETIAANTIMVSVTSNPSA